MKHVTENYLKGALLVVGLSMQLMIGCGEQRKLVESIHSAIELGDTESLDSLLSATKGTGVIEEHGSTFLCTAILAGKEDVVWLLIDNEVPTNGANEDGQTPLHCAAAKCDTVLLRRLLGEGTNINRQDNERGTALTYAIADYCDNSIALLLSEGADVNRPGFFGGTPLHQAVMKGSLKFVNMLLGKGAEVNAIEIGLESTPLSKVLLLQNNYADLVARGIIDTSQTSLHELKLIEQSLRDAGGKEGIGLEEAIVGKWYEVSAGESTLRAVFMSNGNCEILYSGSEKWVEGDWSNVDHTMERKDGKVVNCNVMLPSRHDSDNIFPFNSANIEFKGAMMFWVEWDGKKTTLVRGPCDGS